MLNRAVFQGIVVALFFAIAIPVFGQNKKPADRPRLIVGVVVDQMRWDYLYKFQDRYVEGGFKRMLREGFSCENTQIDYAPTVTAIGHSTAFTGSVPSITGIIGNGWYDRRIRRGINNVEDTSVLTVGAPQDGPSRSPHNMLTTTVGDELKISNGFQSKVIGVAIKDRGAILPAGHLSNGSYWYDSGTGHFVTSTFYMDDLPEWVKNFNARKLPEQYLTQTWETLFPIETYTLSEADDRPYENKMIGKKSATFPYEFGKADTDPGDIRSVPFGNTITMEMAKAAIEGENLGSGEVTDMLTVSFSATDGLGHTVGPNAIEIEDMYLRLDREFAEFFEFLDERYGSDGYLFFITADHGVSQSPGFLKEYKLPTGVYGGEIQESIDEAVQSKYGIEDVVEAQANAQIYLNWDHINAQNKDVDTDELIDFIIRDLLKHDGIVDAWPTRKLGTAPWPDAVKSRFINGYNAQRGGDIVIIMKPGWKGGSPTGATHGLWYPYDNHIPLVWMGWHINAGETNRLVRMTDIAPTISAMLDIQMPSGSIGDPILEITDRK